MAPTPKILIFAENYLYGGLERYLFDLANALSVAGYSVEVVHNRSAGFSQRMAANLHPSILKRTAWWLSTDGLSGDIDRLRFPALFKMALKAPLAVLRLLFFPINVLALSTQLKLCRPAVVHIVDGGYPGSLSGLAAATAAGLCGTPRVVLSILSMPAPRKVPLLDGLLDSIVSRSVGVVMPNSIIAGRSLSSLHGFPNAKIIAVHTGLDMPANPLSAADRVAFRLSQNIKTDESLLCFVASFEPGKGHEDLLEAFALLLRTQPKARLVLVGDGKTRLQNEALAKRLGLSSSVIFAGYCTDSRVKQWVSACDLFVFPSHWEGLPYSIIEAMQSAKPIIATSVGGIPELVEDGVSGLLVPPKSPPALADAIVRLLADRALASRFGRAAQKRAKEEFSMQAMMKKTEEIYFKK